MSTPPNTIRIYHITTSTTSRRSSLTGISYRMPDCAGTPDAIADAIYAWGPAESQFSGPQIAVAVEQLADGAWVEAH